MSGFWTEARRRLGDGAGTRALIGVLLLQRRMPAAVVIEAMDAALAIGSVDPEVVAIEARRIEARRPPAAVVPIGTGARDVRPRAAPGGLRQPAGRRERVDERPHGLERTGRRGRHRRRLSGVAPAHGARRGRHRWPTPRPRNALTHRAYLAEVLSAEVDQRDGRRRARRLLEARFPRLKRLDDFDLAAAPTINPASLAALAKGAGSTPANRSC